MGEIVSSICNFCLNTAAREIVAVHPSLRYSEHVVEALSSLCYPEEIIKLLCRGFFCLEAATNRF